MKENKIIYNLLKLIYVPLIKIIYRPTVKGIENIPNEGLIILAGNHIHAIDPILVMANTKRAVHFLAKESLFKGIGGIILKCVGTIKVYRTQNNPDAIIEAVKVLKQQGCVGIFPEGTRNKTTQKLLQFKHGTVVIAKQTNSKIVPFAITGNYKLFRKNITIEFGKPIDISKMEIEEANNYLRKNVDKLLK